MRAHIPNIITLSNLFCGMGAIVAIFEGDWALVAILLIVALLADFLDGFIARRLKVSSPLGEQLDSLSDMVSFGVVPGLIMAWLAGLPEVLSENHFFHGMRMYQAIPLFAAAMIPLFSAVRLGRFNLDQEQRDHFVGLPTPANAMLIASFWLIRELHPASWAGSLLFNPWVIAGLSLGLSLLLVARLPLLALKFKHFRWEGNQTRYLLIIGSAALLVIFREIAIPMVIVLYLILSWAERWLPGEKE